MKRLILLFPLLFSGLCQGQKNSYIIKVTGDTVWGNVILKNQVFHFTDVNNPDIDAAEVSKIKSDTYKGTAVVKCRLQLYSDNLDDYELDFIKRGYVDTVMILDEILTTPRINLYYGTNNFKTQFYFYKTPSDTFPVQLVVRYYLQGGLANYSNDRPRYMGDKSKVAITEDKGYVNQLYAIMANCKKIPPVMWELLSYRGYSFKQLIKYYNKCK